MPTSSNPHLDRWHNIVFQRDMQDLQAMLAEKVVFHSPYLWKPYHGRQAAWLILSTVSQVFEDFAYHRELINGRNWALEFSARIGDLSGIVFVSATPLSFLRRQESIFTCGFPPTRE